MKIKVLPAALNDLKEITDYVTENFGLSFALKTQASFVDTFNLLLKFPQLGRARPEVTKKPVRFFHLWPYWITYESTEQWLRIHRVYHAARDLSRMNRSI